MTNAPEFVLRVATAGDSADVLAWRNDPDTREMSGDQSVVSPSDHEDWYAERLARSDCCIYIAVADDDTKLGMVRFDKVNRHTARVSINVSPGHRGRGVGARILQRGIDTYLAANVDVTALRATIRNENAASERIFAQAGFSNRMDAGTPGFFAVRYSRT